MARPKIIDKWNMTVDHIPFEVPVRMIRPERANDPVIFVVQYSYGDHTFSERGADINKLKLAIWAWLKEVVTIKTEKHFLVEFNPECNPIRGNQRHSYLSLAFGWRRFEVGTTSNGKTYVRDLSQCYQGGEWMPSDYLDERSGTLIPATEENEKALRELYAKFEELSDRLERMLKPENIQKLVCQINSGVALLASPNCANEGT